MFVLFIGDLFCVCMGVLIQISHGLLLQPVQDSHLRGDLLGAFFYRVNEFLFSFSNPPPIIRYETMSFVRPSSVSCAVSPVAPADVVPSPVFAVADVQSSATSVISPTECYVGSIVSSVNFVSASA